MEMGFTEEDCSIKDQLGKTYRVQVFEKSGTWCLVVYDGEVPVGLANCVAKRDVLTVDDLHVSTDVTKPARGLPRLVRNLFSYRTKGINYRSRGLGTEMLRLLISRASKHGFNLVEASLSPQDLAEDPGLPDWYQRNGFTLVPAEVYGQAKAQLHVERASLGGTPKRVRIVTRET